MGARQYTSREWRLLSWWLATYYAGADIRMNERLGPTPPLQGVTILTPQLAALSRVRNRWADAVIVEPMRISIVEAKLEPDPGIFSQLIHYARKLRGDPSYAQMANLPIRLVAVVYHDDPSVSFEAPWYGVEWNVFTPDFSEWPLPSVKGTPFDSETVSLPQDWPARLAALGVTPK